MKGVLMIVEELQVDENLIHLENVIFDLDSYKFDRDVIALLNQLKSLVDKKLYSNFNLKGRDIAEQKMYIRFKLKEFKSE